MQQNRLTVMGRRREVTAFQRSHWLTQIQGRCHDPLELSPTRYACQFETDTDPLPFLQKLSRQQPGLVLLLEYEVESERVKGLAKVKNGQVSRRELRYCTIYHNHPARSGSNQPRRRATALSSAL